MALKRNSRDSEVQSNWLDAPVAQRKVMRSTEQYRAKISLYFKPGSEIVVKHYKYLAMFIILLRLRYYFVNSS